MTKFRVYKNQEREEAPIMWELAELDGGVRLQVNKPTGMGFSLLTIYPDHRGIMLHADCSMAEVGMPCDKEGYGIVTREQ